MSLLIKALQKAEDEKSSGKADASLAGLSLEPKLSHEAGVAKGSVEHRLSTEKVSAPQQAAAGVFSAKQQTRVSSNSKKLLLTGVISLLLLFLIGLYVYSYVDSLSQPAAVAPPSTVSQSQLQAPSVEPSGAPTQVDSTQALSARGNPNEVDAVSKPAEAEVKMAQSPPEPEAQPSTSVAAETSRSAPPKSKEVVRREDSRASAEGDLKITRNPVVVGVHPDLTAAYRAFNQGDDATAQLHYRRVLQSDVLNTDALLGMAAIAARQGRDQDAGGWYAKVLEVDPRNTIAQSALASGYAQVDPVGAESRIKNMLAVKPDAAHLHAALGNVYAEREDWLQAQQAYFQAFHTDPSNADYAFNLAISLDHLGKGSLALQYYKEAQELLAHAGSGNIDRAQLEARILQLQ